MIPGSVQILDLCLFLLHVRENQVLFYFTRIERKLLAQARVLGLCGKGTSCPFGALSRTSIDFGRVFRSVVKKKELDSWSFKYQRTKCSNF